MSGLVSTQQQTPDLVCFTSLEQREYFSSSNGVILGNEDINYLSNLTYIYWPLYVEPELKNIIGYRTGTSEIFINKETRFDTNWSFPFGCLFSIGYIDSFGANAPPGDIQIIGGTKDFFGVTGRIKFINDPKSKVRKVEIYLNKN